MAFSNGISKSTGIRIIIVGAGFAGLTAAIECQRKGHTLIVLEKCPELKTFGDMISFGPNASRIFLRWLGLKERLEPICHKSPGLHYKSYLGEDLFTQTWEKEESCGMKVNGNRGQIHEIVYQYALEMGIDIRLGQNVTDYLETGTEAGVIANGEKIVGDVVFVADGVLSKGRNIVLGFEDTPKSSGYAIYRAWLASDDLAGNPLTADLVNNGDTHSAWLGPDIHFMSASIKNGKEFSWVCTHKDERDIEESWSTPGRISDALQVLDGWDPVVHAIVSSTPPEHLVDWKLVYRDPLPTWISPRSRIALIGDAAHPFLPTSIQGASQAMEDGTTLAVCLQLAGKGSCPDALRAYEKIRYERVRAAQRTGGSTRDTWHKADSSRVKANPEKLKLKRESWLLNFDAEEHAYEVYADTVAGMKNGMEKKTLQTL